MSRSPIFSFLVLPERKINDCPCTWLPASVCSVQVNSGMHCCSPDGARGIIYNGRAPQGGIRWGRLFTHYLVYWACCVKPAMSRTPSVLINTLFQVRPLTPLTVSGQKAWLDQHPDSFMLRHWGCVIYSPRSFFSLENESNLLRRDFLRLRISVRQKEKKTPWIMLLVGALLILRASSALHATPTALIMSLHLSESSSSTLRIERAVWVDETLFVWTDLCLMAALPQTWKTNGHGASV